MNAYKITLTSATGVHGPMPVPPDFLADNPEPTAVEVLAEFTRRLAEDVEEIGMPNLGFRAPLTITVEDI